MARTPVLLDHRGNPVAVRKITKEVAAPTLSSVNSVWSETVISGLDPRGMAQILDNAARGYPDRFFDLAQEMEERDLHYSSVLGTRKRAITGIKPLVIAGSSDDAKAEDIASEVRELVERPEFVDDYLTDALDALGKGYSIVEILWKRSAKQYAVEGFKWRDPRHFVIDRLDGRTVRLKQPGNTQGVDLPPYQFSIHTPKLKTGLPIRGGLARLVAWAFLFKSYTLKDWMAFLEVYGMPLRVGKYGPGASFDDKRVLLQAVRDISSDAAAIIPKSMEIEFIEAAGGSGNAVFGNKAGYLDKQISKAVLGQTMSTDDGSSLSQAEVHEEVRHDVARADARQLEATINRDVVRPFVDLNHGPQDTYPTVYFPFVESEDIEAIVNSVERVVPMGMQVGMSNVRKRLGFEEPEDDEVLLTAPQAPKPDATDKADTARVKEPCATCGEVHALAEDQRTELDELADVALADWQQDMQGFLKPIERLFKEANNYTELAHGLDDLVAKMDAGPLADRLAKLAMKARGVGNLGDGQQEAETHGRG